MKSPKPVFMASDLQRLRYRLRETIRAIHDAKKRNPACSGIRLTGFSGTSVTVKSLLAWDHEYDYPEDIPPMLKRKLLRIRHRLTGMGHGTGLIEKLGPRYPELQALDTEIGHWMKRLAAYPSYTKFGG